MNRKIIQRYWNYHDDLVESSIVVDNHATVAAILLLIEIIQER